MHRHFDRLALSLLLIAVLVGAQGIPRHIDTHAAAPETVQAPVLTWQRGGCYSSWCETGWYSSAAVADLDNDGTMEVIGATYTLFVLNGEDGSLRRSFDPDGSRVWPGVVVTDLDGNGDLEIITAHGGGYVHVLDHALNVVWSQQPASIEFRSLAVADLEGDGDKEIVIGLARLNRVNVWVFDHAGGLLPGWPQLGNDEDSAAGPQALM